MHTEGHVLIVLPPTAYSLITKTKTNSKIKVHANSYKFISHQLVATEIQNLTQI